jgi:hypothetical protein
MQGVELLKKPLRYSFCAVMSWEAPCAPYLVLGTTLGCHNVLVQEVAAECGSRPLGARS